MTELYDIILANTELCNGEDYARIAEKVKFSALEYGEEVYDYVKGNLGMALLTPDVSNVENVQGRYIHSLIVADGELKEQLVKYIAARAIRFSAYAYKDYNYAGDRREVFMRQVYSFLNLKQISEIAKFYMNKQLQENTQKHSR